MQKTCIIYCRVSTATQAQQGESLDTQEKICQTIAKDRNYKIIPDGKIFREPFSGRKEYRPVFDGEVMKYIKDHPGEVNYLLFRNIDRFTRGGSFSYEKIKMELAKYGVEMVDSLGIIQPQQNTLDHLGFEYDWSKYSPSGIAEIMMADYSKTEVRNILTRTIGRQIELTKDGYHIGPANDGFIIKRTYINGKKKSIQVPDPERAKYWIKAFEMRATGQYEDQEIVDEINAMGYKSKESHKWDKTHERIVGKRGGNPLSVKQLQHTMLNPVYCGVLIKKWTNHRPIKAQYEGLVNIDIFNRANKGKIFIKELGNDQFDVLYDYQPNKPVLKRLRRNPLFPYKFILCPECGKPFCASSPKGKSGRGFPTYHCSRDHKYLGISKKEFEGNIEDYIHKLKFTPEFILGMEVSILNKYRERQKEIINTSSAVSKNVSDLKQEQALIIEKITQTNSPLVIKQLEEKAEKLEEEIIKVKKHRDKIEVTEQDIRNFISWCKNFMEHPAEMLLNNGNLNEKQALFELVFEKTPTYDQILNGTPKLTLVFELSTKNRSLEYSIARDVGIEPTPEVLETPVLPLY